MAKGSNTLLFTSLQDMSKASAYSLPLLEAATLDCGLNRTTALEGQVARWV